MVSARWFRHCLLALLACGLLVSIVFAQQGPLGRRPLRLAERTEPPQAGGLAAQPPGAPPQPAAPVAPPAAPNSVAAGQPNEHPLAPAIRWANEGLANIEKISDYSATLVKRERVNGKLNDYEYIFVKVRHKPFSVYLYFLAPADLKGREVIFIDGQNNGNIWAHTTGIQDTLVGTVKLPPTGMIAMRGQRYPLTEIGILNLTRRLVEIGDKDMKYGECDVKFFKGAKINDRVTTCIQVVHPQPRRNFLFHVARIFVDEELNVPIRYEAYDWPAKEGDPPGLMEEYTYLNMKLNNGFSDADFDTKNPNYRFR